MNIYPNNLTGLNCQEFTILVIDDDPANLAIITKYLEDCDFTTLIAEDGESGLQRARYAQPDLILLDVLLPGIDGFETCRRLKSSETTCGIPVIFTTSLTETDHKLTAFQVGAVDYITKPFQYEEVLARVVTHLQIKDLTHRLQEVNEVLEKRVEERTAALAQTNQDLQAEVVRRQQIEEALRVSEHRYRTLFNSAGDAIFIHDLSGRFLEVNQVACDRLGYSREELLQMGPIDIDSPEYAAMVPQRIQKLRRRGHTFFEVAHVCRDGTIIPIELSSRLIEYAGHPAILSIARDITDRKQAEVEREVLIAELEAKNAELENFTYTVSHDLKSPLITIQGFLGFLERAALAGNIDRVKADIARISNATRRMELLLNDLLALSRIGRSVNPPQEIPFNELVAEAAAAARDRLEKQGGKLIIASDLPTVYGDRARLRQVLDNLLDNAIKYSGDQPQPCVEIDVREDGGETIFFVRDNGIGIDRRYHERVFDLFHKLNHQFEGSGVGLAIVKRIVELHGGRIWVESEGIGNGSTFCFTLPDSRESAKKMPTEPTPG